MNTFLFMYMNSRDVIICYLELRKTRSVFPIPLEFEISMFACIGIYLLKVRVSPVELIENFQYRTVPKFLDTRKFCCNQPKIQTKRFLHSKIYPNCAERMANSAESDRTAPLGLH